MKLPMSRKIKLIIGILVGLILSLACAGVGDVPPISELPPETPRVTLVPLETPTRILPTPSNLETATVAKVIDGDTVELTDGRRVRYIGINTPERDQPFYDEAATINRQLVEGKRIQLELDVEAIDRYGRILAYVWSERGLVNLEIVRQGFANSFTIPPNVRYQTFFRQAEREAREAERGLWVGASIPLKIIHIEADAPGDDRQNPNGEWVKIANQGNDPVHMRGFTLSDAANNKYTFTDFAVLPGATFRLFSGQGEDTGQALYWGLSGTSLWNNDTDTAFLRDDKGALIDSLGY